MSETEMCPACRGGRLQRDSNALLQRCPACGGSGVWVKPNDPGAAGKTAPLDPVKPPDGSWEALRKSARDHMHVNRFASGFYPHGTPQDASCYSSKVGIN